METKALAIDTDTQRNQTVGVDELLTSSLAGCFMQNPGFVNTPAPNRNIQCI